MLDLTLVLGKIMSTQSISQPILSLGSTGEDVTRLQEYLQAYNYNIVVDGIFYENTENAVKHFQSTHNLTPDGIVGDDTWSALESGIG